MTRHVTRTVSTIAGLLCGATVVLSAAPAAAQNLIKRPGAHPDYSVELEPHLLVQWIDEPFGDAGLGLGFRAAIPIVDNGPITTINNNLAIGFGFDWAHFQEDGCWGGWWWRGPRPDGRRGWECSGNDFWFPVYAQWNFFFTDVISVFGEAGFALQYETVSFEPCDDFGDFDGDCDDSDLDPEFIFQGGGRFLFGDTAGLIVRVGVPFLTVGASILM